MGGGHIAPVRTCIGCRRRAPSDELTRVIRRSDGTLEAGRALPGRGAWLCTGSTACLDQAARRDAFKRALRGPVEPGAVAKLGEALRRSSRDGGRGASQRRQACEDGLDTPTRSV